LEKTVVSVKDEAVQNEDKDWGRVDPATEWRSGLSGSVAALLAFMSVSGVIILLLPFSVFNQFNVIIHTLVGTAMLAPAAWFVVYHWNVHKKGNLSHYQLLGYLSLVALMACIISGLVLTWQGLGGTRIDYIWVSIHMVTGLGLPLFLIIHLVTVILRKNKDSPFILNIRRAQRRYYAYTLSGTAFLFALVAILTFTHMKPAQIRSFVQDYNWRFGEDRPFAPSLARLDYTKWMNQTQQRISDLLDREAQPAFAAALQEHRDPSYGLFKQVKLSLAEQAPDLAFTQQVEAVFRDASTWVKAEGSIDPKALTGSKSCGSSGCHEDIYREWLPGAHRYSSLDDMFQRVQVLMAEETSPEHTRYCAGCHDPISLFSGAKNSGNITLNAEGSNEGNSCLVCHSIVQADVQGNGDYTIRLSERYLYEHADGLAKLVSDFLIRTYPEHHISSYSRPLYKTTEFCAACHKQYVDKEVNTDIGKVQGQNQYDSWKNSRWYHEDDEQKTIGCRECHMPLNAGTDPASGDAADYNRTPDDNKHRSHRFLASNQYIPILQELEGAYKHVELTEKWLRGDIAIPEIADKWTEGPVVRLDIVSPQQVEAGEDVAIRVILTNNKTGHDFPTGPLDMIESWIEVKVSDAAGNLIYHSGELDDRGNVVRPSVVFKLDGFDRKGELIDRHNLWDLVGASYKRSLYPGVTDAVEVLFQCPSMARRRLTDAKKATSSRSRQFSFSLPNGDAVGELNVTAVLWYRKANPEFLDRVYGLENMVRSPHTEMSRASSRIKVVSNGATSP
jgi:hypothetical protein